MTFHIISIFPKILDSYLQESIIGRARKKNIIKVETHDLRKLTTDKHRTVDEAPYGGGAGMLMQVEPIYKAVKEIKSKKKSLKNKDRKVVLLSASGKKWTQKKAQEYSKLKEVIFICGRYEGVDARVKEFIDEEISIGDYVLTGGELPAMIIIDSISRLLPNVLGNQESSLEESHSLPNLGEYPQYTRPESVKIGRKKYTVPKILLSGDHEKIKEWRKKQQKKLN